MPRRSDRPIFIACIGAQGSLFHERLSRGAQRYLRQRPRWFFRLFAGTVEGIREAHAWRPQGAVGFINRRELAGALASWRIPIINTSGALRDLRWPYVGVDNLAVGRMAGQHLLQCGYRRFAYVGVMDHGYSQDRLAGLREVIASSGADVRVYDGEVPAPGQRARTERSAADRRFRDWLRALPDRTGLMAATDTVGVVVCDQARLHDIPIPDRLAVITGLDEEMPSLPPLTSVRISENRWGYAAAQALAEWMETGRRPAAPLLLPPEGVNVRESTSPAAHEDDYVARAMRFIREHADQPVSVEEVTEASTASRRSLERHFSEHVGCSILHAIHRAHVEHAKLLLIDTNLSLSALALRSGFSNEEHLRRIFTRLTGTSPGGYRQQFRAH